MSLSVRRGGVAACLATALALTATGCAAGFDAPTNEPYIPTNGAEGRAGDIKVRNVLVVKEGTGPLARDEVYAVFVNVGSEPDVLTDVRVDTATGVNLSAPLVPVQPQGLVQVGGDSDLRATLVGSRLVPGDLTRVTFAFRDGGIAELPAVLVQKLDDVTAGS